MNCCSHFRFTCLPSVLWSQLSIWNPSVVVWHDALRLAALQIRLNVGGRSDDPAFTFVEFNQLDSAREGCAVCSLDMTAEPERWKDAICKSLSEIRKLGLYGVTPGEMERYASSLMTDAEQLGRSG